MSWERRLREMVLAGGAGALAAVGCVDGSIAGSDSGSDGDIGPGANFCCNANSDPCCPSLYCGATATMACADKMACEAEGGTWDYGGVQGCAGGAGTRDATPDAPDTGPSDAGVDGRGQSD